MASAAPPPASTFDALDMVVAGMRYLNAGDPTAMVTAEQARILTTLEQVHSMGTAVHAAVLGAFTAAQGYCEDGQYSPRSWLIHQAGITRAAAFAHTAWSARAQEHPEIAAAMATGILSESWARAFSAQRTPDCGQGGSWRGSQAGAARFPGVLLSRWLLRALLLPERFSRCCPQPGYRSGHDQGPPGGDPRPAPLHGPGHPGDIEHGGIGFAGDREHRQPPRVAQAPPHAEDHPHGSGCKFVLGGARGLEQGGGPR